MMKKTYILLLMIATLVMLSGCGTQQNESTLPVGVDKEYCEQDADCICGGKDVDGSCYIGNTQYYEEYVDKKEDCPDFCTGIGGNMILRCVANECIQTFECITDDECGVGVCVENKCS